MWKTWHTRRRDDTTPQLERLRTREQYQSKTNTHERNGAYGHDPQLEGTWHHAVKGKLFQRSESLQRLNIDTDIAAT
jgi:hypothetical protein